MSEPTRPETDLLLTSPTLLDRLRQLDDDDAWREFLVKYERLVKSPALRRGLSSTDADDIAQEVFRRVAESIHTFERRLHQGGFRGWLKQLARWRVGDFQRRRRREQHEPLPDPADPDESRSPEPTSESDPIAELEAAAREELIRTALRRLQGRMKLIQIQAFEMLVLDGRPVTEVCWALQMNPAHVYVAKHRVTARLHDELANLRKELG